MNTREFLEEASLETLVRLGSAVHSAKIKKGNKLEEIVRDFIKDKGFNIVKGYKIEFNDGIVSSQNSYKVDNILYIDNEILLIDNKSSSWNNNTPMDDTVRKYVRAKNRIQKDNPNKKVRFILLKNSKTQEEIQRYIDGALVFGIEILHANTYLSELTNENVNLDKLSNDYFHKTIKENYYEQESTTI